MSVSWIGIGANLGDAWSAFNAAWNMLGDHPQVQTLHRSGLYRTSPIGVQAGGRFTNAVFSVTTSLSPLELLDQLQFVENQLGRTHDLRWGPRPIDLDLLFYDQRILTTPRLTLPHPAAWYRRFVLDPLVEVVPTLVHPALNESVAELRARVIQRPLTVACFDADVVQRLHGQQPGIRLVDAACQSMDAGIVIRLGDHEAGGPAWNGIPVADLTASPGEPIQRVTDFLSSISDQPQRTSDW
ncbi:MAG: 2-amino-4-hydroxy-6-hydroxymethyldihydropteridine diphosphokinase [Planctomycetes bacterium]|nr:2-amino-4-hydroxy-6-hydroxymethyldihydropteridine diphosphokinase [Planctomycetota bacterium]